MTSTQETFRARIASESAQASMRTMSLVRALGATSFMALLRGPAAVDQDRGAGHQRRSVGGKKQDRAHEVLDRADASELDLRHDPFLGPGVRQERLRHRRLDEGWGDGV